MGACTCLNREADKAPARAWFAPAIADEVPDLRDSVIGLAYRSGMAEERLADVRLAVSEALSNCVLHAFRDRPEGTIAVTAVVTGRELLIRVCDDGCGISVPNPASPGLGLGVSLMQACADNVRIDECRVHGGTCVALRFAL